MKVIKILSVVGILIIAATIVAAIILFKPNIKLDNEVKEQSIDKIRIVMASGRNGFLFDDELYNENDACSVWDENGYGLYSVEHLTEIYDAKFTKLSEFPIYKIENKNGIISYLFLDTTLAICDKDVIFSDRKTVVKNGICYADCEVIGKALNLVVTKDFEYGLVKFNSVDITESDKLCAEEKWGITPSTEIELPFLMPIDRCKYVEAFRDGRIYKSDVNGVLKKYMLNDINSISCVPMDDKIFYTPDTIYIEGIYNDDGNLYTENDGNLIKAGETPDKMCENSKLRMKRLYQYEKYRNDVLGEQRNEELDLLKQKIANDEISDFNLDEDGIETLTWQNLCEKAKAGDVILCNRADSTMYGYNNHSALILEVLPNNTLHLLHARSAEYGVGFEDEELDYLDADTLLNNDYWKKTSRISLYSYESITNEQRQKLVDLGKSMFKGYRFGYYNLLGKNEITCAELIKKIYDNAGIPIGMEKSEALQTALSGNLNDAIFLPDHIMMTDNFKMLAMWNR